MTIETTRSGIREWTPHDLIMAREWENVTNTVAMLSFLDVSYPALVEYDSVLLLNMRPPVVNSSPLRSLVQPPPPPPVAERKSPLYPGITWAQFDQAAIISPKPMSKDCHDTVHVLARMLGVRKRL